MSLAALDTPVRPTSLAPGTALSRSASPSRHRSLSRSRALTTPPVKTPTRTSTSAPPAAAPSTDSPGTWRHPRLDEITRRKRAATFNDKNARMLAYCALHFALIWVADQAVQLYLAKLLPSSMMEGWCYVKWTAAVLRLGTLAVATLPLFRASDDLSDIPLSPGQRKLLGLPPSTAAASPAEHYSTPPRYARTPSHAGSVNSNRSFQSNHSPLSGRGDPVPVFFNSVSSNGAGFDPRASITSNDSSLFQFSPAASPLLYRGGLRPEALVDSPRANLGRRYSIGATIGSPKTAATLRDSMYLGGGDVLSPSPTAKRTSVAVNNKWLFERGRRPSGTWAC